MEEKGNVKQIWAKADKQSIAFYGMLIGAVLMIAALFLPFGTAAGEYTEYLNRYPKRYLVEEMEMTNAEGIHISLIKFFRIYYTVAQLGVSREIGIACMVIISLFAFFAILTAICSVRKKPVPAIIFDILSFAVLQIVRWDFQDRGVIPSSRYDWGIASYIAYIGIVIVFAGAVMMLAEKKKQKKQQNI